MFSRSHLCPQGHHLYVFQMPSNVIIQHDIQHSAAAAAADHWHCLWPFSYFCYLRFKYYMSLKSSDGSHGCRSLCVNIARVWVCAYVLMHRDDSSAAWSSAAAPSAPLKKTLPDAPTMQQDSGRKCQASQNEEQERWWRSSWGEGI